MQDADLAAHYYTDKRAVYSKDKSSTAKTCESETEYVGPAVAVLAAAGLNLQPNTAFH